MISRWKLLVSWEKGTSNFAVINSFRKVHVHSCLPLQLKFEGIVWLMTTLTQVGMWTACVTSISWDHHRKLRTQQCHNHNEKSSSPTIELWELQIPSDPHAQSCPTLRSHVLEPARPFCPWNFPGKNTGWVAIPYSRGSTWPRDWTRISSHLDWQPDSLPLAPLKPTQLF